VLLSFDLVFSDGLGMGRESDNTVFSYVDRPPVDGCWVLLVIMVNGLKVE
jgi:hypothetical protein